jgi:hypothetical protein
VQNFCRRRGSAKIVALLILGTAALAFATENPNRPRLYTNEAFIEDVTRPASLPISDVRAMFQFVLESLPDRVKVYPTENCYYFWFYDGGARYAGNIRLDAGSRDQGKVHFHYALELTPWNKPGGNSYYVLLDRSHGVSVERVDDLMYRVSFDTKSVIFELNGLSKTMPPPHLLGPGERYLGPIFDESAIRFFLVYNPRLKLFHYLLDETEPFNERLFPANGSDRILIGHRTGFAFYRDHRRERKILIGVFDGNVRSNSYYDGPFDQLPENFIVGESLRSAIIEAQPDLAGKIDRFGSFHGSTNRYLIDPYLTYSRADELLVFHVCAEKKKLFAGSYYAGFTRDRYQTRERRR